jgi:hypothetical protein
MAHHPQAQPIASHVAYEIEMFFSTIDRLGRDLGRDVVEDNRRIEAVLLHARVIYDFLFVLPRSGFPDVSARHFFDDPSMWEPKVTEHCPYLAERRERLNRSLPHLSYDRLKYDEDKRWDLHATATELKGAWECFFAALPAERRQWFTFTRPPETPRSASFTSVWPQHETALTDVRTMWPK